MKDNKIIGFSLELNFGFSNHQDYKVVINKIEDMITDLFKNNQDAGAILLGGKTEFIREYNDKGIQKLTL